MPPHDFMKGVTQMKDNFPIHKFGEFGGRCLAPFKADVPFIVGAEISAEQAMKWPLANRKALFELHKIEWYGPPEDAEKRLHSAKKATEKKVEAKAEHKSHRTPPAVKKSSRTK